MLLEILMLLLVQGVGNRRRLGSQLLEALTVLECERGGGGRDGVGGQGGGGGHGLLQKLLRLQLEGLDLEGLLLRLGEQLTLEEGLRLAGHGHGASRGRTQLLGADDRVGTTPRARVGRDQADAVPDGDERVLLHLAQNLREPNVYKSVSRPRGITF